jgi:uncharacterized damage-inducible protein DinB
MFLTKEAKLEAQLAQKDEEKREKELLLEKMRKEYQELQESFTQQLTQSQMNQQMEHNKIREMEAFIAQMRNEMQAMQQ